jgi:hypothetical protein
VDSFLTWLKAEKDRAAGWLLIALGAIAVLIGYQGVADSPFVAEELAYIASGAIGGLFLLGLGATLLITADIRDEWRKLDRIDEALRDGVDVRGILTGKPGDGNGNGNGNGSNQADDAGTPARARALAPVSRTRMSAGAVAIDRGQRITGSTMFAGAVLIGFGWLAARDTADPQDVFRALTAGVSGLVLAAAASAAGILWMRRAVFVRRNQIFRPWFLYEAGRPSGGAQRSAPASAIDTGVVLTAKGLTRYHRAGCPVLEGVAAVRQRPIDKVGDLQPCGICEA